MNEILCGNSVDILRTLPADSVRCCVTSPPYFHLRDYKNEMQIGMENTVNEYIQRLVEVFREVRRVLTADGTCWINIADGYGQKFRWGAADTASETQKNNYGTVDFMGVKKAAVDVQPKNLIGVPWKLAFALQDDGWILRQDIIWHKTNAMPESVKDRCTKSHEYIFLLCKNSKYYFNGEAIAEPLLWNPVEIGVRGSRGAFGNPQLLRRGSGNLERKTRPFPSADDGGLAGNIPYDYADKTTKNKRDVWSFACSKGGNGHYAAFPDELAETCIKAGSEEKDTVLDPFVGSGTTCLVAYKLNRNYIGIDLNENYCEIARNRLEKEQRQVRLF